MPYPGSVDALTLTVEPHDITTLATVTVAGPGATVLTPTATSADHATWTANPTYTAPGRWVAHWTVTGTGAGVTEQTIWVTSPASPTTGVTTDPTTDIGVVRLLAVDMSTTSPLFTDDQIGAFLTLEGSNVRRAAALALETTASNEALISKKIRTQDLQTDGPAVAAELRARATALRAQAAQVIADEAAADDTFAFDVVDFDPSGWLLAADELAEP